MGLAETDDLAGTVIGRIVDHAATLGVFERVNGHEPKAAPAASGLTAAVWVDRIQPVPSSGLNQTSARLTVFARVYTSMLREPQDAIDPAMTNAVIRWCAALLGDLQLKGPGGTTPAIRTIDVRGPVAMDTQAGYLEQDKVMFRVYTITIPCIVNDVWSESA